MNIKTSANPSRLRTSTLMFKLWFLLEDGWETVPSLHKLLEQEACRRTILRALEGLVSIGVVEACRLNKTYRYRQHPNGRELILGLDPRKKTKVFCERCPRCGGLTSSLLDHFKKCPLN